MPESEMMRPDRHIAVAAKRGVELADSGTMSTIITAYTISMRPAMADVLPMETM